MKTLQNLMLITVLLFGFHLSAASQNSTSQTPVKSTTSKNFVDKNNDGICDNLVSGNQNDRGRNFVDANNDGICDNKEACGNKVKGANYVDKNNDGICDNRGNRGKGHGNGYCHRNGNGRGNGCCCRNENK
jgi:hypothetical protein